jgi:hypothetical protein
MLSLRCCHKGTAGLKSPADSWPIATPFCHYWEIAHCFSAQQRIRLDYAPSRVPCPALPVISNNFSDDSLDQWRE